MQASEEHLTSGKPLHGRSQKERATHAHDNGMF
jgi:hypothetical protein